VDKEITVRIDSEIYKEKSGTHVARHALREAKKFMVEASTSFPEGGTPNGIMFCLVLAGDIAAQSFAATASSSNLDLSKEEVLGKIMDDWLETVKGQARDYLALLNRNKEPNIKPWS
jgi:hypothetical protein